MSMVTSAYNKWVVVLSHFGLTRLSKGAKKWRTSSSFQSIQRQMVVPKLEQVSSTFLIVMLCLSGDYGVHRIHRPKNPHTLSDSTLTPAPMSFAGGFLDCIRAAFLHWWHLLLGLCHITCMRNCLWRSQMRYDVISDLRVFLDIGVS